MKFGRRRDRPTVETKRRSGPPGEARWWEITDQQFVESDVVDPGDLGRGWRLFPMLNNVERLDPYGIGEDADRLRMARDDRGLTALDEGRAFRRRATGSLLVQRLEMFATVDSDHRRIWREHGVAASEETWRQRWRERDEQPGWIEARWFDGLLDDHRSDAERSDVDGRWFDDVDWIRIEDHTGGTVAVYHHVTVWADRLLATLTMRSPLGEDEDPAILNAARILHRAGISRRSGPGPGFA